MNVRNEHSISESDDRDESVYEDPYSTNIYDIYNNERPEESRLDAFFKHIEKRKWLFLFFLALSVIAPSVVGLSIHFTKNQVPIQPTISVTTMTTKPPVKEAVLVLSTYIADHRPLVIGLNGQAIFQILKSQTTILGKIDDDINFTRDFNSEVYGSCAASFRDQMYVFGGYHFQRQVNID